jgi:transposase
LKRPHVISRAFKALAGLLQHLSKPKYWYQIERDLHKQSIEVYALPQDVIRCDATTVSGAHEVTEGRLLQFGQSKDDPTRPQIKVMMGSLGPLGDAVVDGCAVG